MVKPLTEHERSPELGDQANHAQEVFTSAALEGARRAVMPQAHPSFDGRSCVDCGQVIPKARLAMGRVRCVYCQTGLEHRQR